MKPVRVGAATLASAGLIASGTQLLVLNTGHAAGVDARPALLTKPAATPKLPASPAKAALVYATTWVNVRASASTSSRILGVLPKGGHVGSRGPSVNGWTPVTYQGTNAWIATTYLTTTPSAPSAGAGSGSSSSSSSAHGALVYATTRVNVRASATTSSAILGVLPKGGHVGSRGPSLNGWTPVNYQGTNAWIATTYLTTTPSTGPAEAETAAPAKAIVYATSSVRVRAGATTSSAILGSLNVGDHVGTRGTPVNGWTPVSYRGANAWVASAYLSTSKPVAAPPANNTSSSPSSNSGTTASSWSVLRANGSSGLDGLRPSATGIVNRTVAVFPQIKTIYGVHADSLPDHPSGHAVDLMLPHGAADNALGWSIANYFKSHATELGVQYIMFDNKIWNIARNSEGWRAVADRGSVTANHMDHVHITTIWD
jgi:uncharacterized protein YgiM (DUF1202 family)